MVLNRNKTFPIRCLGGAQFTPSLPLLHPANMDKSNFIYFGEATLTGKKERFRSSFLVASPIFSFASLRQTSHTRER